MESQTDQQTNSGSIPHKFIVCGLGRLGQYCVTTLKEFGVPVVVIEKKSKVQGDLPSFADLVENLVIGDCRQPKVLEQAGILECRAILLVTSDERINIEAAFAARALNPNVRLIVRSAQENLNELLAQKLGNFAAFEATQLPVVSFALEALGTEILGFFKIEDRLLRVINVTLDADHRWCDRRQLYEINNSYRRLLTYSSPYSSKVSQFYQWEPEARISQGNSIVYVEMVEDLQSLTTVAPSLAASIRQPKQSGNVISNLQVSKKFIAYRKKIQQQLIQIGQKLKQSQTSHVAALSGIVMLALFLLSTVLYKSQYETVEWYDAINVSLVLLLGGFDNLFGQLKLPFPLPWWLYTFSLSMTVAGTLFVGVLYALLTERVLGARFQLLSRRPPVPPQDHVVLVGFGRVGQRVAKLLQELKQPIVAVNNTAIDAAILPGMPLVIGNSTETLQEVNLPTARSILVVTDDEVTNLEIGLRANTINPSLNVVIRTFEPQFTENVARLLPYARVLGAYALAAEAFAAAAFGENVLDLFRLNKQTILVVEYQIQHGDTLAHKLIAEVAYGYNLIPIMYQKVSHEPVKFMPSDDVRLQEGDRLIVLATTEGLRRAERGDAVTRQWQVKIERAINANAAFEGSMVIARISGCEVHSAREIMDSLPQTLPLPLYQHQAQRLVRELSKVQVYSYVESIVIGNES